MERKPRPIHFSEMLDLLRKAEETGSLVNLRAWKTSGEIRAYSRWEVVGSHWRGGVTRLLDPQTREVRQVPQIFIFEIMGHRVFL